MEQSDVLENQLKELSEIESRDDTDILIIDEKGRISLIYSEKLPYHQLGEVTGRRLSHVEMTENGKWTADLSPVGGPNLGPFTLRSEAIKAEIQYLKKIQANGKLKI